MNPVSLAIAEELKRNFHLLSVEKSYDSEIKQMLKFDYSISN